MFSQYEEEERGGRRRRRTKKKKRLFFITLVELASQLASYDKELTSENIIRSQRWDQSKPLSRASSSIISMHIYFMLGWLQRMKKMAG